MPITHDFTLPFHSVRCEETMYLCVQNSVYSNNTMVFVMKTQRVFCEEETQLLNIIYNYMSFRIENVNEN